MSKNKTIGLTREERIGKVLSRMTVSSIRMVAIAVNDLYESLLEDASVTNLQISYQLNELALIHEQISDWLLVVNSFEGVDADVPF